MTVKSHANWFNKNFIYFIRVFFKSPEDRNLCFVIDLFLFYLNWFGAVCNREK